MLKYMRHLAQIQESGLAWFDIAEDPSVLRLSKSELQDRISWLHTNFNSTASVPMIGLIDSKPGVESLSRIKKYCRKLHPHESSSQFLKANLPLDNSQIMLMYYHLPRISRHQSVHRVVQNTKAVLKEGFSIEDIVRDVSFLKKLPLSVKEKGEVSQGKGRATSESPQDDLPHKAACMECLQLINNPSTLDALKEKFLQRVSNYIVFINLTEFCTGPCLGLFLSFQNLQVLSGLKGGTDLEKCLPSMAVCLERLAYLEGLGISWYSIAENLHVLTLSADEVDNRRKALMEQYSQVTAAMLGMFKPESPGSSHRKIKEWLHRFHPYFTAADYLQAKLKCSEEEVICLCYAHPRLGQTGLTGSKVTLNKLVSLRNAGFSMLDICQHLKRIQTISHEQLKKRLVAQEELRVTSPTHWVLGISCDFEESLAELAQVLGIEPEDLRTRPLISFHGWTPESVRGLTERASILVNAGYKPSSIIRHLETLSHDSLARENPVGYAVSLAQLETEGLGPGSGLTLSALGNHVRTGHLLKEFRAARPSRYDVAEVLGCSFKNIRRRLPKDCVYRDDFTRHDLAPNWDFLQETCGFHMELVQRLPHVLCIQQGTLKAAWAAVTCHPRFETWRKDPWILINVLLYTAEKTDT